MSKLFVLSFAFAFSAHHPFLTPATSRKILSLRTNSEFAVRLRGGGLLGSGMYVTKADFERAGVKYNEYSEHQNWGAVWRSRKYRF
jgi:hypothetical protein